MLPTIAALSGYFYLIAFIFSCLFTFLLIYLIIKETQARMKHFSKLLLLSAVMDFLATCVYTICQAQFEVDGYYVFIRSGTPWLQFPGRWRCAQVPIYATTYSISYYSLPLQSLSRYYIVCWKKHIPRSVIVSLYFIVGASTAISGFVYYLAFIPIEDNLEVLHRLASLPFWQKVYGVEQFCYTRILTFPVLFFIIQLNLYGALGLCLLAYTSYKVHKFLKDSQNHMSKKTLELHTQLGKRLIWQAVIPTLCAINTIILCTVAVVIPKYEGGLFITMYLPYPCVAIVNSLATIISIQSYRHTVWKWLRCQGSQVNPRLSEITSVSQPAPSKFLPPDVITQRSVNLKRIHLKPVIAHTPPR